MAVHATVAAFFARGAWRAVMLRGPSGAGKSDLGLRLVAAGWRLTADDYAEIWVSSGALYAAPPERIAGLIEARGVGLVQTPPLPLARVALVADCVTDPPERLPDADRVEIEGVSLPLVRISALESSAAVKLRLALEAASAAVPLGAGPALP